MTELELLQAVAACQIIIDAAPPGSHTREVVIDAQARYVSQLAGPSTGPTPSEDGASPVVAAIVGGAWVEASEGVKGLLVASGADAGAFRVFVVPISAAVAIDGVLA